MQDCLNRIFALRLPVNGILDAASRSAIRRLQKQESLPITGIVTPGTEQALQRLCGEGDAPADQEWEGEWGESEWEGEAEVPFELDLELDEYEEGQPDAYSEFDCEWEEFDTELADEEWQGEVNRSSRDYIRWVQSALNKVMGLRLAADGIMGPATRSAIRSFQQRQGLTADAIVGPQTEQQFRLLVGGSIPTPSSPACPPSPVFADCPSPGTPFEVLDNFAFDRFHPEPFPSYPAPSQGCAPDNHKPGVSYPHSLSLNCGTH